LWDKGEKESFYVGCKDRTVVILDSAPAGKCNAKVKRNRTQKGFLLFVKTKLQPKTIM